MIDRESETDGNDFVVTDRLHQMINTGKKFFFNCDVNSLVFFFFSTRSFSSDYKAALCDRIFDTYILRVVNEKHKKINKLFEKHS